MKTSILGTALLLGASVLLAPCAYSQTTNNPAANTYNLDLVSVDESRYSVNGVSGEPFYNDKGKHSSVNAMVSETTINLDFSLNAHRSGGFVFSPGVSTDATWVHRWIWEGPDDPAPYQINYTGSLGASIHLDGADGSASFNGRFTHPRRTYSDSIYGYGSGTTMMSHVASDSYWNGGGGMISGSVNIHADVFPGSVGDGGGAAGPAVNNGNLSMTSGMSLFYPADEIDDQESLDW